MTLAHGSPAHAQADAPGHAGGLCRPANPAHVPHGRSPDRVRGGSSAAPRLTAKLTAKPPDTRGPQRVTMDGYIRPELRRRDRREPPEQLTSPRVVKVCLARRAPICQLASCSPGIKLAWRPPWGSLACSLRVTDGRRSRATVSRWESQVAAFECGSWPAVWMARRTTCSGSTGSLPQTPGRSANRQPDRTEGGEGPADSPVLADTVTLDPVEVGWLAVN